jgi:hypothetical protein
MSRWPATLIGVMIAAGIPAGTASGDGLPIPVDDAGGQGVATGEFRYVTMPAAGGIVLAQVNPDGGRVVRSRFVKRRLTVPAVALDGTPSGLSANGQTLVLIRPRAVFPQRHTRLAIVDTAKLRVTRVVTLSGDFSFDAISPNGRLIYLIQYTSPRDPTRYAVRVYDVTRARLLSAPIVDPHEPDEDMHGYPLTRTVSRNGRWAYTLYDGGGKHPFIHALDTSGRTARCIDLEYEAGRPVGPPQLSLDQGGSRLVVADKVGRLALVDARTFEVSAPAPASTRVPPSSTDGDDATVAHALLGAAGIAVLLGAGILSLAWRRRRLATP